MNRNAIRAWTTTLVTVWMFTAIAETTGAAESALPAGMLQLDGGDFVTGSLVNLEANERIGWKHDGFASPFEFPITAVRSISFPTPAKTQAAQGVFCFELVGGDRVFGSVSAVNDQSIRLQTTDFGELEVDRSSVHRLFRWQNGESVSFIGPGKLEDWTTSRDSRVIEKPTVAAVQMFFPQVPDDKKKPQKVEPQRPLWQDRGGQLFSDQPGAALFRDVGVSRRARIDLELSWKGEPDFVVAIGVFETKPKASSQTAFRLEVWEEDLVAVWETDESADVVSIGNVRELNERFQLTIELDQQTHVATIRSAQGRTIGELQLDAPPIFPARPGIYLQNLKGVVQIDGLQVMQVNPVKESTGSNHPDVENDVLFLADDEVIAGDWTSVSDDVWILDQEDEPKRIRSENVRQVQMASAAVAEGEAVASEDAKSDADAYPASAISKLQVVTHSGIRVTGRLVSVVDGNVLIFADLADRNVKFPLDQVRMISRVVKKESAPVRSSIALPRMEAAGLKLRGKLVAADVPDAATPLAFEPLDASESVVLSSLTGKMVYREPLPPLPTTPKVPGNRVPLARAAPPPVGGLLGAVARAFGNQSKTDLDLRKPRAIFLRSGEIVPCQIKSIDLEGITFESETTTQTRVPHDRVMAVQLMPGVSQPDLDEVLRERLLTVPRMRKKNPPTHLIIARNGDVMRGRLVAMTQDEIEIESRLETVRLPRSVVSQIVWLHPSPSSNDTDSSDRAADENSEGNPNAKSGPSTALQVQAVYLTGVRMSMTPKSLVDGLLVGESDLLGQCKVRLSEIKTLRIGNLNEIDESESSFVSWRLSDAPEPTLLDDAEGGGSAGTMSALVGTAAPSYDSTCWAGANFESPIIAAKYWCWISGPRGADPVCRRCR